MQRLARAEAIEQFTNNDSYTVFLISLKAGGCGLNLTRASHVFLMDPWWNVSNLILSLEPFLFGIHPNMFSSSNQLYNI